MKEPALVIIKPDGVTKELVGPILTKFSDHKLEIIAIKIVKPTRKQVEHHYSHLYGKPFFQDVITYLLGKGYKRKEILVIVFFGDQAIKKCRKIAGATNPEEAHPFSIRGSFGRITTKGLYENVVHVSSDKQEARREIKLWFRPEELVRGLYPIKKITTLLKRNRVWL